MNLTKLEKTKAYWRSIPSRICLHNSRVWFLCAPQSKPTLPRVETGHICTGILQLWENTSWHHLPSVSPLKLYQHIWFCSLPLPFRPQNLDGRPKTRHETAAITKARSGSATETGPPSHSERKINWFRLLGKQQDIISPWMPRERNKRIFVISSNTD